jgi:hypothetical protein
MEFIKKYRWPLLVIGSVVLIGVIILFRGSGKKESPGEEEMPSAMNFYLNLFSSQGGEPDVDPSKVQTFEEERVDFIKRVILEKDTVCVGEDFEVKVLARDHEGRDKDLIYKVAHKIGNPVIMRYSSEGAHEIVVTVRDFKRIDTKAVTVNAVKCEDRPIVHLKAGPHPMRPEEGEFEVFKKEGLGDKCTYFWEFGDGNTKTTNVGYATHNYFARDQKRFHSSFVVKVTVTDENRKSATARSSIDFPNTHWISANMGNASIPLSYNRFMVMKNGVGRVDVSMKNIYDEALSFSDATLEFTSCDSGRQTESRHAGASTLLSQTSIMQNAVANAMFTLGDELMPRSTCNVTVKLKGSTQGGKPVMAIMYLTIPVSREDLKLKTHQVIDDPELDRKVQKAKKILGKDFVTTDELRTLEKEGRL